MQAGDEVILLQDEMVDVPRRFEQRLVTSGQAGVIVDVLPAVGKRYPIVYMVKFPNVSGKHAFCAQHIRLQEKGRLTWVNLKK